MNSRNVVVLCNLVGVYCLCWFLFIVLVSLQNVLYSCLVFVEYLFDVFFVQWHTSTSHAQLL